MTDDPIVICTFKEKKSRRDIADRIVRERPDLFPDRSAVFRKGFNLLVETLRLETEQRKTKVDGAQKKEKTV